MLNSREILVMERHDLQKCDCTSRVSKSNSQKPGEGALRSGFSTGSNSALIDGADDVPSWAAVWVTRTSLLC